MSPVPSTMSANPTAAPERRHGCKAAATGLAIPAPSEAGALLARFGLSAPGGRLQDASPPAALSRIEAEGRRLARLARVRHPAYDLDRHIAVRRLLALVGRAVGTAPAQDRPGAATIGAVPDLGSPTRPGDDFG